MTEVKIATARKVMAGLSEDVTFRPEAPFLL